MFVWVQEVELGGKGRENNRRAGDVRVKRDPWRTEHTTLATSRIRRFCSSSSPFRVSAYILTIESATVANCSAPLQW